MKNRLVSWLRCGLLLTLVVVVSPSLAAEKAKTKVKGKSLGATDSSAAATPKSDADDAMMLPTETPESKAKELPSAPVEESGRYGKSSGLLGPITVGPTVTLLGFPTPFRFGLEAKYLDWAGLSADYGFFPTLTLSEVKVNFNSWRVAVKVYPFQGSFYLGFAFGKQNLTTSLASLLSGTTVNYSLSIDTTILVPQIGWRWQQKSGFFFGMELGVQIAGSAVSTLTTDASPAVTATAEYQAKKTEVEDRGKTFGQTSLPHFALVQFGYLF